MLRRALHSLLVVTTLMMLVGCNNSADKSHITSHLDMATTSIASLREGVGHSGATIYEDIVLRGRVTSSDSADNIYHRIYVEDDSSAVEVLMGVNLLDALYPEGLDVALHLKGCRVGYHRGVLQVGMEAIGGDSNGVGYIDSREGIDRVVRRGVDVEPRVPLDVEIASLCDDMCGRLVRIRGVVAVASSSIDTLAGETLDDAVWRGNALFKSLSGDSIAVYTSSSARYADARLPLSVLDITGILEWGKYGASSKECFHLKMRYEEDCVAM